MNIGIMKFIYPKILLFFKKWSQKLNKSDPDEINTEDILNSLCFDLLRNS